MRRCFSNTVPLYESEKKERNILKTFQKKKYYTAEEILKSVRKVFEQLLFMRNLYSNLIYERTKPGCHYNCLKTFFEQKLT